MLLNKNHLNVLTTCLALFPIFFITGPFLADLFVVIIDCSFLYFFLNQSKQFKKDFFDNYKQEIFTLLCFWIFSMISSFYSEFSFNSFYKSFFHIRFFIFLFSLIFIFKVIFQDDKLKNYFYKIIIAVLVITFLSMLFEILVKVQYHHDITGFIFNQYQPYRFSGFFFDEQIIGSFLAKILIIASLLIFDVKKFSVIHYIIFIVGFMTILISGERMATLLSCMYFFFYFIICWKKISISHLLKFIPLFFLLLAITFSANKKLAERYGFFLSYLQDKIVHEQGVSNSAPNYNYFALIQSGYNVWKTSKLVGVGVRNYRNVCKEVYSFNDSYHRFCDTHPHNLFSEILAETGSLGILSFLSFILVVITKTYSIKSSSLSSKYLVTLCIICIFWPIGSTGSFFNNHNSTIIWYLLGFIIYFRDNYAKKI